jgi:hypothetical protein
LGEKPGTERGKGGAGNGGDGGWIRHTEGSSYLHFSMNRFLLISGNGG